MMVGLLLARAGDSVDTSDDKRPVHAKGGRTVAGYLALCLENGSFEHGLFDDIPALRARENAIVNRVGAG